MTDYKKLVEALRCCAGTNTKPTNCPDYGDSCGCGGKCLDKHLISAAAAIEALQAEVDTLKRTDIKRCQECLYLGQPVGEQLLPKRGEIVRCGECKYWCEVDTSDGLRYGQCDHPHSAIRGNCFIRESWFCADGEREVQE